MLRERPVGQVERKRVAAGWPLARRGLRFVFNDTVLALLGVLAVIAGLALAGVGLTWLVFRDRYGVGFFDYLTEVVF